MKLLGAMHEVHRGGGDSHVSGEMSKLVLIFA